MFQSSFEQYGTWGAIISQWLNNERSWDEISFQGIDAVPNVSQCFISLLSGTAEGRQLNDCGLYQLAARVLSLLPISASENIQYLKVVHSHSNHNSLQWYWRGVKFKWPPRLSRFHVWLWLISGYWFVLLCLPGLQHVVFHQNIMLILEREVSIQSPSFMKQFLHGVRLQCADCFPICPTVESFWSAQGALSWAICTQWDFPENADYEESHVAGTSFNEAF